MPVYETSPGSFVALKDAVVVLTGGANGVGESIVRTLYGVGAKILFGDIDAAAGEKLVADLTSSAPASTGTLEFLRVDVRRYEDNLALFDVAYTRHGRVDHALSLAGVTEGQNWFDPSLTIESVRSPPSTAVLDINLLGAAFFARIAAVYLSQPDPTRETPRNRDKSLLLTGSLAAFKEQQGLFVYQPSKHGVMGLFRSSRRYLHTLHGIRVNIVCPSLIDTGMASRVLHVWQNNNLPVNSANQVAEYVLSLTASRYGPDGTKHTGLAVYVEGGKGWEFESELDRLDSQWMGEEMAKNCAATIEALGVGGNWVE
ncbi:putative 3-hydroxyacyl-CoA dehydrogenase [Pleurostoma richardsiae]|uniref:3-hydroxyacyl-CoA dehydrogenase n=1 Tax=Pleurostoma richardsiae TaxID=41990 RepID=A0AA38R3H7_9PEZI|nr:putative 3-hydroxyacyl-CoA dehydrogenase [Pleurostoma richardsiae]